MILDVGSLVLVRYPDDAARRLGYLEARETGGRWLIRLDTLENEQASSCFHLTSSRYLGQEWNLKIWAIMPKLAGKNRKKRIVRLIYSRLGRIKIIKALDLLVQCLLCLLFKMLSFSPKL